MKLWMRVVVPFTIVMSIAVGAHAQMWGVGAYGGMQACPYPYGAAQGATSDLDGVREAQDAIDDAKRQLRAKKAEKKSMDRQVDRWEKVIDNSIRSEAVETVKAHMQNLKNCGEYEGWTAPRRGAFLDFTNSRMPADASGDPVEDGEAVEAGGREGNTPVQPVPGNKIPHDGVDIDEWAQICGNKGSFSPKTCSILKSEDMGPRRGSRSEGSCAKALTEYRRTYNLSAKIQGEIEDLEAAIEDAKESKRIALQEARDEAEERRRDQLEGGICYDCLVQNNSYTYQRPATDWASVIGNVGLGLVSMYAGYKTNKMVANANANIGWPTDPWAAQGYGYGLGAIATGMGQVVGGGSGIYGAMGGGIGAGGFGCAGNNGGPFGMMGPYGGMNGAGMWGNPYGMAGLGFPGMGGGMYNPGMGPWGMAGPFGGLGGGLGMGMGMPGMGMAGMGYPGMGMAGGLGMAGMGMPGMGMAGMGYPGMGMAGGLGMAGMGMPGMGMAGMGYPGMGMAGGLGMAGMGMPGMGMAGMGYPGMGMAGGLGMAGMGMPGMGMPGMGMAGGLGMAGMGMPGMGAYMGGMQMQQQMMQMQMQQYQMYMQQQQQYVQQQMQRQQVVASLQQELYGLLYRIQQVQYGGGYLGGSIGGSIGGGIGIGGTMGGGLSTIPGTGTGSVGTSGGLPAAR